MASIITKEKYKIIKAQIQKGKKVGLCHGVFDLIHPGHIIHFEEAKSVCDILVVSITASKYVRKGPGRPYFDDEMRLKFLSEIKCIDYVMLSEGYTVDDIIECVEPDLYIKGQEYAKVINDVTGMIDKEVALVRAHGGDIYYTSGQVFSSTKLINRGFSGLPKEVIRYSEDFITRYSMNTVREFSQKVEQLKVLVVGDVIIDKYTYCQVQGLMSKDMGYSARFQEEEEYLGGSIAVARHISDFVSHLTLCSVVGNEQEEIERFQRELGNKMKLELIQSDKFPTIVKHRYIQKNKKREEFHKLFAINNIPEPMGLDVESEVIFKKKLEAMIDNYDVVVLCDFGHGLISEEIIQLIQAKAHYLALNCQANSTNLGLNVITKYSRADIFSLDQKELKLAFPFYNMSEEEALHKLTEQLGSRAGFLTRGAMGGYGIEINEKVPDKSVLYNCPAFTLNAVDTVGAGDAFFAISSIYMAADAPVELGLFMGNIAGALAVNIVGNKEALEKANVLKFASTILNV